VYPFLNEPAEPAAIAAEGDVMVGRVRWYRRLIVPIALAVSLFLMAAPTSFAAGADIYGVGGGSQDFGTGTKIYKFAFSAHTGPNGDFGSAQFTIPDPNFPLDVTLDVDCVNVQPFLTGNGVWFGGPIKKVSPQPNAYGLMPGDEMAFHANDFGNPSGLVADEYGPYYGSPQICKVLGSYNESPISQGNINIKLP
jgi:hypothetical protein